MVGSLNPDRVYNFDGPDDQADRSGPRGSGRAELTRREAELDHLLSLLACGVLWELPPFNSADLALRRVADIAFAGDGSNPAARTAKVPAKRKRPRTFRAELIALLAWLER